MTATPMLTRMVGILAGVAMVAAVLTGRADVLVRPWFLPVVAVTGILLVLAAWRTRDAGRLGPGAAGLLLLPVVAGAVLSPGLVARMPVPSDGTGTVVEARIGDADNPLLSGEGGEVTLLQIVLAERRLGAASLDGREVILEAVADDADSVSRMVMVCCAADARPVTVPVAGDLPAAGQWVRIHGVLVADGATLVVQADTVEPIDPPRAPLL